MRLVVVVVVMCDGFVSPLRKCLHIIPHASLHFAAFVRCVFVSKFRMRLPVCLSVCVFVCVLLCVATVVSTPFDSHVEAKSAYPLWLSLRTSAGAVYVCVCM